MWSFFVCRRPTAPDKWTTEPVLVKIYKLILNELRNQMTKAAVAADDDTEEDDDVSDVTFDAMYVVVKTVCSHPSQHVIE